MLPIIGENSTLQLLFDGISELGLHQVNHVKNRQRRYLDLLLNNLQEDFVIQKAANPLWKNEAYHTAIEYSLFVHRNSSTSDDFTYEIIFDFDKANFDDIKQKLNNVNWQTLLENQENPDIAVSTFYDTIYSIFENMVPKKRRRTANTSKYPIWFSKELKTLKNRKQKAHKLYSKAKTDSNLRNYSSICNELNIAIKRAHENYIIKIESNIKTNSKTFFNYTKEKMKGCNFPTQMNLGQRVGKTKEEISNLFADYFQDVYTRFSDQDRDYDYFSYIAESSSNILIRQLSVQEIYNALTNLNASKGPGPDGIPPRFIKNLAQEFTKPLFWLFNMSLQSHVFPSVWKQSFLLPIYKSGKKSDIKNYRGIAILSCIPKLFEAMINQKIFEQVKHVITSKQHGFFKGRSTATNLLQFVSFSLDAMDKGRYVDALYTDFSKAFDRIDIPLLIFKLKQLGFEQDLLKWIESYLTHRSQTVSFCGHLSQSVNVTSGVPQGSHLGPLLFILFVNDVTSILNHLKVLIYADDMKLYMTISEQKDIVLMQHEINLFYKWCNKNLLELNINKCHVISYSRKHSTIDYTYSLGQQNVSRSDKIKDLGVILDSKMTFTEHFNVIIHKANNMLCFIKRFSYNFNDPYTIKTLFISFVRPILEYCSIVWSPHQIIHAERIESIQKQFLLYALRKLGWRSFPLPSYAARCMLINIQTLKKRRDFSMICFINDIVSHRIDCNEILSHLNFYAPVRSLRTRNLFYTNTHRTNYALNEPVSRIMKTYNNVCENIDVCMSKNALKRIFYNL